MSIKLERIGWEDEPSTKTPIDSGNLKKMEENAQTVITELENLLNGKVLFENSLGTKDDITLSNDNFTNYKRIKILGYYSYNNGEVKTNTSLDFEPSISNRPSIAGYVTGGGTQYLFVQEYNLTSNKLSKYRSGYSMLKTNSYDVDSPNNYIYITKIIGFQY